MKKLIMLLPLFCMLLLAGCKEFQEIQVVGVDGFNLNKISTDGIEAEVKLNIKNPNQSGFSIYPSEFDVMYSGIRLGKAKLHKRVHIDGHSEKAYTFNLRTNFGEMNLLDATKLLNISNHGTIELNGDLKAGKFYLKKRFPVNFKEKINMLK